MSNLITSAILSAETLESYENNLIIANRCQWEDSDRFGGDPQIGNTLTLRKPINVLLQRNNMAWVAASSVVQENSVVLVVDRTITVPMSFSEGDLALKVNKFVQRYIKPAARNIASGVDFDIPNSIVNSALGAVSATSGLSTFGLNAHAVGSANAAGYAVGAYGTALTPATVVYAKKVLADQACPLEDEIFGVLSTTANSQLVLAQASIFNPLTSVEDQYKKGLIGMYAGIQFAESQSLASHTNGAQATLVLGAGALATGWAEYGTIAVTATGAQVNAGDVFQVPGVYLVNPLTKAVTDVPFQFQVVTTATTGATSVVISPAPVYGGQYQNISANISGITAQLTGASLPGVAVVGSAAVGLSGVESLIFHKSAISIASPAFSAPKKSSMDMSETIQNEDVEGLKLRFLRTYDALGASGTQGGGVGTGGPGYVARFDGMYGIKVTNPSWIVRVRS